MDGFRLGLWRVVVSDAAAGRIECWKELQRILFQLSVRINNVCVCVCTQLSLACEAKFLLICMGSLQLPSLFPRQDAKESAENTYEFHISNTNELWSTPTSNWDPLHSAMAYC
jgi:hypothetical protein